MKQYRKVEFREAAEVSDEVHAGLISKLKPPSVGPLEKNCQNQVKTPDGWKKIDVGNAAGARESDRVDVISLSIDHAEGTLRAAGAP